MSGKKFPIVFSANMDISEVKRSVDAMQKAFNGLNMSKGFSNSITTTFKKLIEEVDAYNELTSQAATSMQDMGKADKALENILHLFEKIQQAADEIGANKLSFVDSQEIKRINSLKNALEKAKQAMSGAAISSKKADLGKQYEEAQKKAGQLKDQVQQLNNAIGQRQVTKLGIEKSIEGAQEKLRDLRQDLQLLTDNPVTKETRRTTKDGITTTETSNAPEYNQYKTELAQVRSEIKNTENEINRLTTSLKTVDTGKLEQELVILEQNATMAAQEMQSLASKIQGLEDATKQQALDNLKNELSELLGLTKDAIPDSVEEIESFVSELEEIQRVKVDQALRKVGSELGSVQREADKATASLAKGGDQLRELNRAAQDVENLKNQVLDFFSISNTIQIFKDAVRDAFNTVKELDAAMTETAVVTDFSIGDMWDKLPEYSEQATKLGTSIKSLYEATTLYYQQGLNSEQAMGVGIETMKMARVANMDAAAATEAMTAALRGFNMEINEISATRISDVYSELAAITAADTSQIATAMSKTASIAASANMEFETTAALLAQIIETTQEAPETAGTAMKTIIARFTEVKKLYGEGMLTGEDTEGEEININKIDEALKTVGISLKDFLNGAKGIDDIFLELASKWDTLDLATQRYIATAAAGSRQQSRFIAMMSDYDRTMELVDAANNSAGASQKQFDKTLESLDAKLQRLRNAWQEFTMGLANSDVIKLAVDALTLLIETVNKLTGIAGNDGIGGIVTMFMRLATVIGALKGGQSALHNILSYLSTSGFGPIMKVGEDGKGVLEALASTSKRATNDLKGIVAILKDPAMKGEVFSLLASKAGGFLSVLTQIAPFIAVVVALGAAINVVSNSTIDGRIKGAQSATEEATKAATEAAQKYESLTSTLDSIKNQQENLNNLTTGTQEWKEAVVSLNKEFSNLLEEHPELSEFVTMGENNVLTIKYEEAENVIKQKEKDVVDASIVEQQRKIAELQLQQEKAIWSAKELFGKKGLKDVDNKEYNRMIEDLVSDWADGVRSFWDQTSLDEWLAKQGITKEVSYEDISSVLDAWAKAQGGIEGRETVIAGTAFSQADIDDFSFSAQEAIAETNTRVLEKIYKSQKGAEGVVSWADRKAYAKSHGLEMQENVDLAGNYSYFYYKPNENGKGGAKVEVTDEDILNEKSNNYINALESLAETLNNADEGQLQLYSEVFGSAMMSKETLAKYGTVEKGRYAFDIANLNDIAKDMGFGDGYTMASAMGIELHELASLIRDSFLQGYGDFTKTLSNQPSEEKQNLFKTFTGTEDYTEIKKKILEIVDAQGDLTGADINELASEYKTLEKLIDDTGATAEGMASIMQGISDGSISVDSLTDSWISAVGQINAYNEALERTLKRHQEMNLGTDEGLELQGIYGQYSEELQGHIQSGNYGSERAENILDLIYGSDWDKKDGKVLTGDERVETMNNLSKWAQGHLGDNMTQGLFDIAKGNKVGGGQLTQEEIADWSAQSGITFELSNGELNWTFPEDMDVDAAAKAMMEGWGGSEELWKAYIAFMSDKSPDFRKSWDLADYQTAGTRAAEEANETADGKKFMTQEEVDKTQAQLQAEAEEKFGEGIEINYEEQLREAKVVIVPDLKEDGVEAVKQKLQQAFETTDYGEIFTDEFGNLNLSDMLSSLKSMGVSDEVATNLANDLANSLQDKEVYYEIDGEKIVLSPDGEQSFVDALNASISEQGALQALINQPEWQSQVDAAKQYADQTLGNLTYEVGLTPKINLFGTYAKGTKNAPKTGESLVGEEGPELIETRDGAYLSGTNGPEIFPISRGDVVHTAKETAAIFKRGGKMMPRFEGGNKGGTLKLSGSSGGAGSGRGGSNGKDGKDEWENPFDKLYNLVRNIDEELRQRERIERRYEKLLKSLDVSANKIVAINREELAQLEKERELQEGLVRGREWQIQQYLKENQDLLKYANVEKNERGENVLRIDWDAINAVRDSELGERIEEYVGQLEEWFDSLQDAEEALWDIEDAVEEIKDRGKDQYLDLEDRIKEALIQSYQDEIDKLSEINDSINDTNASLLDAIQTSIDKQRQDRENAKTEADLAEKQRRLAYLQQDTSGANAMEILKLEEEIREGQQDYTDSLIDQKISELQQQNDEAAKQREQQITLMQAQLDQYIKSGEIWNEVYLLMQDGLSEENGLITGSRLEEILKNAEGFIGLSEIGKMEWLSEIERQIAEALAYLKTGRQLEDIGIGDMQNFSFIDENGQERTGYVDEDGNVFTIDEEGNFVGYSDVYQGADGKYYAGSGPELIWEGNNTFPYGRPSEQGDLQPGSKGDPVKSLQLALYGLGMLPFQNVNGSYDISTENAVNAFRRWQGISPAEGFFDGKVKDKLRLLGYKTGGLADFTGPAWLDGTKAHPELVLNAKDTQNFIQLKDILGSLMNHPINSSPTENNGDTSFDIDINVESIGSDYDVERMAAKVKSLINQDARYRNNNAVSLMR